ARAATGGGESTGGSGTGGGRDSADQRRQDLVDRRRDLDGAVALGDQQARAEAGVHLGERLRHVARNAGLFQRRRVASGRNVDDVQGLAQQLADLLGQLP